MVAGAGNFVGPRGVERVAVRMRHIVSSGKKDDGVDAPHHHLAYARAHKVILCRRKQFRVASTTTRRRRVDTAPFGRMRGASAATGTSREHTRAWPGTRMHTCVCIYIYNLYTHTHLERERSRWRGVFFARFVPLLFVQ